MRSIVDGSRVLATYNYLGESTAVQIQYPLANAMLDLWGVDGGFDVSLTAARSKIGEAEGDVTERQRFDPAGRV